MATVEEQLPPNQVRALQTLRKQLAKPSKAAK